MFTVHYRDGKVYLVFADESAAEDFSFSFHNPSQRMTLTVFDNKHWALEYAPIIDAAAEHKAALAHGKEWDHDQILR